MYDALVQGHLSVEIDLVEVVARYGSASTETIEPDSEDEKGSKLEVREDAIDELLMGAGGSLYCQINKDFWRRGTVDWRSGLVEVPRGYVLSDKRYHRNLPGREGASSQEKFQGLLKVVHPGESIAVHGWVVDPAGILRLLAKKIPKVEWTPVGDEKSTKFPWAEIAAAFWRELAINGERERKELIESVASYLECRRIDTPEVSQLQEALRQILDQFRNEDTDSPIVPSFRRRPPKPEKAAVPTKNPSRAPQKR